MNSQKKGPCACSLDRIGCFSDSRFDNQVVEIDLGRSRKWQLKQLASVRNTSPLPVLGRMSHAEGRTGNFSQEEETIA